MNQGVAKATEKELEALACFVLFLFFFLSLVYAPKLPFTSLSLECHFFNRYLAILCCMM